MKTRDDKDRAIHVNKSIKNDFSSVWGFHKLLQSKSGCEFHNVGNPER